MSSFGFTDRLANALVRRWPVRRHDIALERAIVSFSFDDVPESAFQNGAPLLEDEGVRGTFYAAGGIAGQLHDGFEIMKPEHYAALAARGHEIGHHGFAHRQPVALGRRFREDVEANDAFLAATVPGRVRNYAYPYGLSSPRARRVLAPRFRSLRSAHSGINAGPIDLDYLRAVDIWAGAVPERLS
jgi:peptidoglycan/xylan/chitin deacetylase (PgdA/CDA1 family)